MGFLEALITAPVLSPSINYRPCGRVGIVIGQRAPSGIWVRTLPSGPWSWRYTGGRGFGFVGRQIGRSVIRRRGEGAASRAWLSPVLVRAFGRVWSCFSRLNTLVVRIKCGSGSRLNVRAECGSSRVKSDPVRVRLAVKRPGQVRVNLGSDSR